MNNNNIYFSCFSLIRACVFSLFDNFFKVVAVCLIACFVLLSPAAAFASTTESMLMYANTRSVPAGYNISFSVFSQNKDTNTYTEANVINLIDNHSGSSLWSAMSLNGLTNDNLVGFHLGFVPTISGNFYSEHIIDFSAVDFRIRDASGRFFTLSPYSVPVEAYAQYLGSFDYQIYDGSVDYDRWIYDNTFVISKPVSISLNNNGLFSDNAGFDVSVSVPSMSATDILDVTAYRNIIKDATSFNEKSIEDYSYENMRISCDVINVYLFYDIDKVNFIPWSSSGSYNLPSSLNGCDLQFFLNPHPDNGVTSVNVRDIDYLNDTNFSLKNISNGISYVVNRVGSGLSNVVTNATDNANRIIQNTTQKVDEVKQGVTDVKNSVIETKNSILDLPNKIKDMLLGLIIPSDEDIAGKYDEFSTLLEAKLGVIYQIPAMILELFQTLLSGVTDPQTTLTFPSLSLPWIDGTQMKLWDSIEFEIIPTGMDVLKELIQTVTSMVCVIMTFNSVKRIYENFLRGR